MAIILILFGCFILYGKSKYFPENLSNLGAQLKKQQKIGRIVGYLLFLISYVLLTNQLGWGTAIAVFFTILIFGLCLVLIVLPLNRRYVYFLGVLSLLVIIIENIL